MSELNQDYVEIVVAGFAAEKDDNTILQALFEAGAPFSDLRATFNDIIKEKGLRLSAKDRAIKVNELLEGWTPEDTNDHLGKIALVQNECNIPSTKAASAIRKWAKDNNVTLPKKEREAKAKKEGFGGMIQKILDYAMANQDCTRDTLAAFCKENDIKEAYAGAAYNSVVFARGWNTPVATEEASESA